MLLILLERKEFFMQLSSQPDVEETWSQWPRKEPMLFPLSRMLENHSFIDLWLTWLTLFLLMLLSQTKLELLLWIADTFWRTEECLWLQSRPLVLIVLRIQKLFFSQKSKSLNKKDLLQRNLSLLIHIKRTMLWFLDISDQRTKKINKFSFYNLSLLIIYK
jgi:hypothetical protein